MAITSFLKALGVGNKAVKIADREAEILARRALQGDEGSLYMLSEKTGLAPDYIINGAKDIIAGIDAGKGFDRSGGVIPDLWHGTAATFTPDSVKVLNQRTGNVESYPKSVGDEILRQAEEYGKTGMQVIDQNPYGYFDHSYMGSGEGMQAYGYGTYLTETPDIARGYRDANLKTKTGNPAHDQPIFEELMAKYNKIINNPNASNADYDKAAILEQVLLDLDLQGVQSRGADMYGKEAMDWFDKTIVPSFNRKGSLYKTEISGTPDDYLLWDKPMSEQPEGLLSKIDDYLRSQPEWQDYYNSLPDDAKPLADSLLSKRIYASDEAYTDDFIDLYKKAPKANHEVFYDLPADKGVGFTENMLGSDFYRRKDPRQIFTSSGSDQESSQFLNDVLGIKGIKYNDGNSRGSVGGTSNYVIFDDKNINITDKWLRPETAITAGLLTAGGAGALSSNRAMAGEVKPSFSDVANFRKDIQRQQDINNYFNPNQLSDYEKGQLNYFLPDAGTVEAPNSAYRGVLDKAGMSLQNLETPLGKPFEGTSGILQDMAYGDAPDALDAVFAPLELAGGVSNFAKNGLLSAFGADKNAQRKILEGLLKEYGY